MQRLINIELIGTDSISMLAKFANIPSQSQSKIDIHNLIIKNVQAGQVLGEVTLKFTEIKPQLNHSNAVIYTISPMKDESEQTFISRITSEYRNIKCSRVGINFTRVPIIVVLARKDSLAPEVAERLRLHLGQMVADNNDVLFNISVTKSPKEAIETIFLKAAQQALKKKQYTISPPNTLQKVLGVFVGFFIGMFSVIIKYNPIGILFEGIRSDYRQSSHLLVFLLKAAATLFITLLSPLLLYCLLFYSPISNAYEGWIKGVAEIIEHPMEPIKNRDIIAGVIISGLMLIAAFSVVFPPAGLAIILPTIIASVGLAGFSTTWLAIFSAAAVFAVTVSLYAMGSNLFDYVTTSHSSLPILSEEPIQFFPASSAAEKMAAASPVSSTQSPQETTGSVFQTKISVLVTAIAVSDKNTAFKVDSEKQSLLAHKK